MKRLITGGARSGKSRFAERYAERIGHNGIYIATAQVWEEEMAERVRKHQQQRMEGGVRWQTIEEPYELAQRLRDLGEEHAQSGEHVPVLVDCMTLWLSNWLLRLDEQNRLLELEEQVQNMVQAVADFPGSLLLVTNEVGDGIVPEYRLGRLFRDEAGRLNQRLAEMCDEVYLVTAGIPVELKRLQFKFGEAGQ
ncbi:bifunctional adenosylcobinamide kinase/adenosylcobinamide-phosphate guanylyltransferase [Marinicrinis lubricantis]|uniref:Adenosylcobinamide kinase n=1 Tax=Marinicrinis lubricantis TaxID=2086470 RepID=A0ABW1IQW8_9BACL